MPLKRRCECHFCVFLLLLLCGSAILTHSFPIHQRRRNIEANQKILDGLNLGKGPGSAARGQSPAGSAKSSTSANNASASKPARPKAPKKEPSADAVPTRRSNRLTTAAQSDPVAAENLAKRQREEEEAAEEERQRAKRAKHEDRVVEAIKRTGAQWSDDEELEVASKGLLQLLGHASKLPVQEMGEVYGSSSRSGTPSKRGSNKGRKSVSRTSNDPNVKALQQEFETMDLKKACKATPDRVYSMAVHPSVDKELVFVGDKNGRLGVCDMTHPEDEDTEQEHKDTFALQAHGKSAISAIRLAPNQPHTVRVLRNADFLQTKSTAAQLTRPYHSSSRPLTTAPCAH